MSQNPMQVNVIKHSIPGNSHVGSFNVLIVFSPLLRVTEQANTAQGPVIGVLVCLQSEWENVGQIRTPWFLVHRAFVQVRCFGFLLVGGKHVHDRDQGVQDLGCGFNQLSVTTIPTCSVQVQTVDIYTCK